MKTGVTAMRLGAILFVLPFLFVLDPSLILQGETSAIMVSVSTAVLSIVVLSSASERYLYVVGRTAQSWEAVVLLAAGLGLLVPDGLSDLLGLGLVVVVYGRALLAARATGDGLA
jgi:TRAP-type uncharacterized transport system fused permease subunit